jgi:hypothetical protein
MTQNPTVPEIPALRGSRGLFYGWFVVAAAFAVTFVGFGCTYSFSGFIESLQRDFGASRGSVSLVFALAGALDHACRLARDPISSSVCLQ